MAVTGTTVEELADGVFAHVQHDGSWWVNNSGFLVGRTGVLAIDACATYRRTRGLLDSIASTSAQPVRTLVNTHFHGDHTYGNALFDDAVIVGHENCRSAMLADTVLAQTPPVFDPTPDWGQLWIRPPEVTFSQSLTLWVDDLSVELHYVGGPAHTDSDVLAWVPERGVLFTGDIVFNGGTPMLLQGSLPGYLEALARVRDVGAQVLVPGHGRPCGPEVLPQLERYTRFVLDAARDGRSAGLTPLAAARELDLGEFAELLDPERIVLNLHRAYADLAGERSVDLVAAFGDAVAYNGGRPLPCIV